MYFYKVKLKYALDRRCESINEKTVKGKRKGESLSLDTLSLEQKKPTIVVAIVGFRMIESVYCTSLTSARLAQQVLFCRCHHYFYVVTRSEQAFQECRNLLWSQGFNSSLIVALNIYT